MLGPSLSRVGRSKLHLLLRSPVELTQDANDLQHLLEKLRAIEAIAVTRETWVDVSDMWMALVRKHKHAKAPSLSPREAGGGAC